MKHLLPMCLLGVFYVSYPVCAQDGWKLLSDVTIETRYDEMLQMENNFPVFGDLLKNAADSTIELSGFIMPLDEFITQQSFVLSSLPFQSCFFCGGAGPETVAEIRLEEPFDFTDKKITVMGVLKLNDSDPLSLYFTLEDSKIID